MAPIKNIFASALMLTAAVAAPVELNRKSHAIADAVSWMRTGEKKRIGILIRVSAYRDARETP